MAQVKVFGDKAKKRIMDGVIMAEAHEPLGQIRPHRNPGHAVLERFGYRSPLTAGVYRALNMAKVGYNGMTASAEDWSSLGYGLVNFCCPSINIHSAYMENMKTWKEGGKVGPEPPFVIGGGPVAADNAAPGGPLEHKPVGDGGILAGASCLAINPSCKVIEPGTPVIVGNEAAGNYIVIFEMCPCGDFTGYSGS